MPCYRWHESVHLRGPIVIMYVILLICIVGDLMHCLDFFPLWWNRVTKVPQDLLALKVLVVKLALVVPQALLDFKDSPVLL